MNRQRRGFLSLRLLMPITLVTGIWVAGWFYYERPRLLAAKEATSGTAIVSRPSSGVGPITQDSSQQNAASSNITRNSVSQAKSVPRIVYSKSIQPIFKQHCFDCHGPNKQEAGLRFDQLDWVNHLRDEQRLVTPDDVENSLLLSIIDGTNPEITMPPEGAAMSSQQVALLKDWIQEGAEIDLEAKKTAGKGHWAFRPINRPSPPRVTQQDWPMNPIDNFILARLEQNKIRPASVATNRTLLRRAFFDTIGLPPQPLDAKHLDENPSPMAYEQLIEKLLSSPHYGEKWATHWLDQVRYADSDGFEIDHERPNAWRFRQWVIAAINANQPFDEFSTDQLAGDLQTEGTRDQLIATGMYRCAPLNREAGTNVEQSRFEQVVNRTNTVASVWLGLSLRCAQCHDHKFDPISQRDYYGMLAFFDSTRDVEILAPLSGELKRHAKQFSEYDKQLERLLTQHDYRSRQTEYEEVLKEVAADPDKFYPSRAYKLWILITAYVSNAEDILRTPWDARTRNEHEVLRDFFLEKQIKIPELSTAIAALREKYPRRSSASVIEELETPRLTPFRTRGDFFQPAETVLPQLLTQLKWGSANSDDGKPLGGTPATKADLPGQHGKPLSRLDLAKWLFDRKNPLTARVIVNRMWEQFFGRGLVSTTDDFGIQGEKPSHPDLLDWLASEFIRSDWDVKHMHRLMLTSATYRQSSRYRAELAQSDPANQLFARQTRRRLPAELLRDAVLAVSGLLNDSIGGRSIKPVQPRGIAELSEGGADRWKPTRSAERLKRGLYIHFQRTTPYPFLTNFDTPERSVPACSRESSTTPLQALNLLNDPVFFEAAARFGYGIAQAKLTDEVKIEAAFWECFSRPPTEREVAQVVAFQSVIKKQLEETKGAAQELCPTYVARQDQLKTATWIMTARLLFNTDEFLNRD